MRRKKIKISCIEGTSSKLALVKIIKNFSGDGLKQSKDIVDSIHSHIGMPIEFELVSDKTEIDLLNELKNIDGKFIINGGTQWSRAKKMLDLGIGADEDYAEFISEYIAYNTYHSEVLESISFLKKIFSKLDKNQLENIFKSLDINDSSL